MKVLIVSSGYSPVPVSKGGAVESLIEYLVIENEKQKSLDLFVSSSFDLAAEQMSKEYKKTEFVFVKIPKLILLLDKLVCLFFTKVLRRKKVLRYNCILQRLYYAHRMRNYLFKHDFDRVVLENHIFLLRIFKQKKLLNKYKNKIIYHQHNEISKTLGCDNVLLSCRKIIVVSNYIKGVFLKRFPQFDKNKVQKLPNVSNLVAFRKKYNLEPLKQKLGINDSDRIVLFAGRMDATKGVLEVIKAFNNVSNSNAKLLIVGSYNYGNKTKSPFEKEMQREALKIKDKTIFTGFVSFYDMPLFYQLADVVVLPSIWDDPAPLSIIEALSSCKPLITTFSGGIPEYALGSSIVLLRDSSLVRNITLSINRLLGNHTLIDKYSELSRERSEKWTISQFYNNFKSLIE